MEYSLSENKVKNPLPKRFKRELKSDIGKYIVIFLLLFISIGFTSGFLVAAQSMIVAYDESFSKYNIEDGHFEVQNPINPAQNKAIESSGIRIYDISYRDVPLANQSTMRFFAERKSVNLVCLMDGDFPSDTGEAAIDRMYAQNNSISIGDTLSSEDGSRSWLVTGYVALSDYSALFSDNNDLMFDSLLFGVAIVTQEEFNEMGPEVFCYAWKYTDVSGEQWEIENEKEIADDLMKSLNEEVALEDFIPRYMNQSINFTGEDMGSDKSSMEVFLYIIVVITAFVYAITTKDTVSKESAVIGTLLASGYTKGELVRHYMAMPLLVTFLSAVVGNVAGYTIFKDMCADLYYNSYSLPTYITLWSPEALIKTTLIPIAIMGFITWFVLRRSLRFSPMNFLRRNLSSQKSKRAIRLNKHIPFFSRFRLRITFQNLPNYFTLFIGIFLAMTLLFFGMGLPDLLTNYQDSIANNMLAEYQYILSIPETAIDEDKKTESLLSMIQYMREVETSNEDAEKFSAYSLNTVPVGENKSDEIMIYGVTQDSKFIHQGFSEGGVYVSYLFADKYGVGRGDTITLKEKYEDNYYDFTVDGVYPYEGGLVFFMDMDRLNETFDLPKGIFTGYFSNTEITDIPEKYLGSVIDYDSLTKVSRQLMKSFGEMMYMIDVFSVILFVFLIYLLTKIIIEKNATSISMTKILGYTNGEVGRLYLIATTLAVVLFTVISFPLSYKIIDVVWRYFIALKMSGWLIFSVNKNIYYQMFALSMASYVLVVILEFIKIRRIPMDEALKNVE